jgi:hypothetical protein
MAHISVGITYLGENVGQNIRGNKSYDPLRFPGACLPNGLRHSSRDREARELSIGSSIRTDTH